MKLKKYYTGLLGLALLGCRPETRNAGTLPDTADTTELAQLVDSGGFLRQDGVDTGPLHTGTYDQLPPKLNAVLNALYPGWSLPFVSQETLQETERNSSGPYFLQADFNQDQQPDYAVQFFRHDTIFIKAFLQQNQSGLQEQPIHQQVANPSAHQKKSKLYLSLLPAGKEVLTKAAGDKIKLTQPAIGVHDGEGSHLYIFTNPGFKKLTWLPDPPG